MVQVGDLCAVCPEPAHIVAPGPELVEVRRLVDEVEAGRILIAAAPEAEGPCWLGGWVARHTGGS